MNNKMAISTYLSTLEAQNTNYTNKEKINRIIDMEKGFMAARWEGGVGE